jgi:hypothetical protein
VCRLRWRATHWKPVLVALLEAIAIVESLSKDLNELLEGLQLASDGAGPLLQRDYWAVIAHSRLTAPRIADALAEDFGRFAPEDLVRFERSPAPSRPLQPGDEMDVDIRVVGVCRVRVLHRNANSITLGTLEGHPEAGRITFGAYPDGKGSVIFHIRSRARASSGVRYAGFVAAGEAMQTTTWTDFVDRVAHTVGDGVVGVIHVETREIEEEPDDPEVTCSPTFLATGE